MLENEQPGHQPRRQRRLPGSHPTHRAEAPRQKVPIDLPRQPHQRMAKVDDLLERRAKQGVLAIVARLAHRSPRQRTSPSKESPTAPTGNSKPQENTLAHPAFLQNRLLAQVKSSRSINRFRILHGRLTKLAVPPASVRYPLTIDLQGGFVSQGVAF